MSAQKRSGYLFSLILLCFTLSCGKSADDDKSETAVSGTFQLVADEVLRPAIDSLVDGFTKENPRAKITVKYVSAGEAIRELLNKDTRAIIVGRKLNAVEQGLIQQYKLTLPEFDMAVDGIACIVSAKSPLAALAQSDLRKIISNEATKWSQLSHSTPEEGKSFGSDAISKVLPAYPSSTESLLDSLYLHQNEVMNGRMTRYQGTDSVIGRIKGDPNAIGFIGGSWKHMLDAQKDSSVKVIPIIPADSSSRGITKPIILHLAYIYQGLYPLTTHVEGYTFENPNTLPRGFFAYSMTAHGQTIFKNFDVLPKTQIIKIVPAR